MKFALLQGIHTYILLGKIQTEIKYLIFHSSTVNRSQTMSDVCYHVVALIGLEAALLSPINLTSGNPVFTQC